MKRENIWTSNRPYISFTFDDFPRSAWLIGREILDKYDIKATYYVSLSYMGKKNELWNYFQLNDIFDIVADGHELGSHTYNHVDPWNIRGDYFEQSILKNQEIIKDLLPNFVFNTLSYCHRNPYPSNKRITEKYFKCCRGGTARINYGKIDLNLLGSFFIDENNRNKLGYFFDLIDKNLKTNGWLIFTTHDINKNPSPFGCTPYLFETIIRYAKESGSIIMPVIDVYNKIFNN